MRYLRGTKELPLILSADSTNIVKWWVDRSYGIHPDARIQTGGTASLGKGSFMSTLIKQRLNTRISTETELVAADDLMPHLCWTNYFLNAKAIMSILRSCIRTISRQLPLRTTEELPVPREQNIWILGIFYHRPNQKGWPSYLVWLHRQYGRVFF